MIVTITKKQLCVSLCWKVEIVTGWKKRVLIFQRAQTRMQLHGKNKRKALALKKRLNSCIDICRNTVQLISGKFVPKDTLLSRDHRKEDK